MSDLFNLFLLVASWKQVNVTLIFKKDNPSDVANYKPIYLLNTIGKVLEKVIHKHVYNFFHEHHVITTLQSGFVPGDSTVNQLADVYNTLDDGKEVGAIFATLAKHLIECGIKALFISLKLPVSQGLFYVGSLIT